VTSELFLAAEGGGVQVGKHPEWHIFGLTINADTVISTGIAAAIVLAFALYLAKKTTAKVPSRLQLIFESVTHQVEKQVEGNLGIRTAPFVVPLAITLFFFILIANWLSVLPHAWEEYVRPPTADVNLTFAMAIFVMILVWITGIRVKGMQYFKHFVEPYPALLPLNLVEELTKPITLSLRLFGNIFSGVIMVALIAAFPWFILWAPDIIWKLFDAGIGIIQAFIFGLLTVLYFGSVAPPKEGAAH